MRPEPTAMPNRIAFVLTASALALAAGAALAQSGPPPVDAAKAADPTAVSGVTVEATPTPKVIERQSWNFTQSFAAEPNAERDQLVRWRDPVCVNVVGLVDAQAAKIKARIEDVAKAVDVPIAKRDCSANIEIVFTGRPQDLMDVIARERELVLGYYHRHDHDRLKKVTRPIQAWYVTAARNSNGRYIMADPDNGTGGCTIETRQFACPESMYQNAFVVADSNALKGKDVGLLSDYLVMLTLGPPRSLDGCEDLPSVIDALSSATCPHDKPDGLTPADAAYLTALYKANLEYKASFAETEISHRMAKILINANKAAN
jgi:hypothetical protein